MFQALGSGSEDGWSGRERTAELQHNESHLFYNQGQRPGLYEGPQEAECVTGCWGGGNQVTLNSEKMFYIKSFEFHAD